MATVDPLEQISPLGTPFFETRLEGEWNILIAGPSKGAMEAALFFAGVGFEEDPGIIEYGTYETAIEAGQQAGRIVLLSNIDHPYIGNLETGAKWRSLSRYIFQGPAVDLGNKVTQLVWHSFVWHE